MATMKHFGLNQQETNRNTVSSEIDDARALFEVYYQPYTGAIEAGCGAAMCSYNLVNGTHACANAQLLSKDLKEHLGFKGFVMSDWWATHESSDALNGLDQEEPGSDAGTGGDYSGEWFSPSSLARAGVTGEALDAMAGRVLVGLGSAGLLPGGQWPQKLCTGGVDCQSFLYETNATSQAHAHLALEVARESVLLLKNDGVLPFQVKGATVSEPLRIAVVGAACDAPNHIDEMLRAWDLGNYYVVGGSGRVIPSSVTTVVDGVRSQAQTANEAAGENVVEVVESLTDDPAAAALLFQGGGQGGGRMVAVACGGANTTEGRDRASLALQEEDFLLAVADEAQRAGTPLVVAMLCPGPVTTPFRDKVNGLVAIFLGGQATGAAVASVLFGESNPGAKSPVTFPVSEQDVVAPCRELVCPYSEGLLVGYRALDASGTDVAFPFGHGLSYSTFDYAWAIEPKMGHRSSDAIALQVTLQVTLTNKSQLDGTEVLQVYVGYPPGAGEPPKVLKKFKKVTVPAGRSTDVDLSIDSDDLRVWDNHAWGFVPFPGNYTFYVGSSSRDIRLHTSALLL
mmetsp:Transcript_23362/g.52702  ORF Transcript_23362/g.52702 Transcript_23362/m.52702 type:complete len:568 (-) Transcript_23362:274-1977(-)